MHVRLVPKFTSQSFLKKCFEKLRYHLQISLLILNELKRINEFLFPLRFSDDFRGIEAN